MNQWQIQELEYPPPSVMEKELCPDEKGSKLIFFESYLHKVCIAGVIEAKLCTEIYLQFFKWRIRFAQVQTQHLAKQSWSIVLPEQSSDIKTFNVCLISTSANSSVICVFKIMNLELHIMVVLSKKIRSSLSSSWISKNIYKVSLLLIVTGKIDNKPLQTVHLYYAI